MGGCGAHKLAYAAKNSDTSLVRAFKAGFGEIRFRAFNAKFFAPPPSFNDSFRNQEDTISRTQQYNRRIGYRVGKKSQRERCSFKLANLFSVSAQARRMPCVYVTERLNVLVVTAEKCRAGVDPVRRFHHRIIQPDPQLKHGLGDVAVCGFEELHSQSAKCILDLTRD